MSSAGQPPLHRAQEVASAFAPLVLRAQRIAEMTLAGTHARRRPGPGENFWQYRRYAPGDPVARIDWRKSARSDKIYVREKEMERAATLCLWCDASTSMAYASGRESKRERAALLGLVMAALALEAGERVQVAGDIPAAFSGREALPRVAAALEAQTEGGMPSVETAARQAIVLMFSDFLFPAPEVEKHVQAVSARAGLVVLVQVLDAAERDFPFSGHVLFEDRRSTEPYDARQAESLRSRYQEKLAVHCRAIQHIAARAGCHYMQTYTDHAPETPALTLYEALQSG